MDLSKYNAQFRLNNYELRTIDVYKYILFYKAFG